MKHRRPLRAGDVHPSDVLRDEYGMNAANRPTIRVDPAEVPEALRPLIPHVERWAISCDVTRVDYREQQPAEDVAEFWQAVLPHRDAIQDWIGTQPEDLSAWPEAVHSFLVLLEAHDEAWTPTPEEHATTAAKYGAQQRRWLKQKALLQSAETLRCKDWAATVALLEPIEDELAGSALARLAYARKRLSRMG